MTTTPRANNLLEFKPNHTTLPDPYKIVGNRDKRDAFTTLCWVAEHTTDFKTKLVATQYLKGESYREARLWAKRMVIWENKEKELAFEAIELYKTELKRQLVVKYMSQLMTGQLNKEATDAFKKLDNMTANSCFSINGADVFHKDCGVCPRRCSTRPEKFELQPAYGEGED